MDILRLGLFSGLVVHKLVWEILKTRAQPENHEPQTSLSWRKRFLKNGKALALILLVLQTLFLDLFPIGEQTLITRSAGLIIYAVGLATALLGRIQLGNNWANIEDARVMTTQALVSKGIYRLIRHPIYVGDILLLIGLELALNSWLVLLSVIPLVVIIRQAIAEEALLAKSISGYNAYRARTKMFIPFVV